MGLNRLACIASSIVTPVSRVVNSVGMAMLVAMMLLTVADVCLRYLLRQPILGSLELTQFMLVSLVFLAMAYTQVKKGHVRLDTFFERLPPTVQAVINSAAYLLSIGLISLATWQSIVYAQYLWQQGIISETLRIPVYPFLLVVAFGSALLCLALIADLINSLAQVVVNKHRVVQLGLVLLIILVTGLIILSPLWLHWLPGEINRGGCSLCWHGHSDFAFVCRHGVWLFYVAGWSYGDRPPHRYGCWA